MNNDSYLLSRLVRLVSDGLDGRNQFNVSPAQIAGVVEAHTGVERGQDQSAPVATRSLHQRYHLLRRERVLAFRRIRQRLNRGARIEVDISLPLRRIEGA